MLMLNIMPVIRARNIENPARFLVKAGFSRHAVHVLLYSKGRSFRLDHIEKLCQVLYCEPHDLLLWKPGSNEHYPDNHPLHKLKEQVNAYDWRAKLATIPLHELKNLPLP